MSDNPADVLLVAADYLEERGLSGPADQLREMYVTNVKLPPEMVDIYRRAGMFLGLLRSFLPDLDLAMRTGDRGGGAFRDVRYEMFSFRWSTRPPNPSAQIYEGSHHLSGRQLVASTNDDLRDLAEDIVRRWRRDLPGPGRSL